MDDCECKENHPLSWPYVIQVSELLAKFTQIYGKYLQPAGCLMSWSYIRSPCRATSSGTRRTPTATSTCGTCARTDNNSWPRNIPGEQLLKRGRSDFKGPMVMTVACKSMVIFDSYVSLPEGKIPDVLSSKKRLKPRQGAAKQKLPWLRHHGGLHNATSLWGW